MKSIYIVDFDVLGWYSKLFDVAQMKIKPLLEKQLLKVSFEGNHFNIYAKLEAQMNCSQSTM